MMREDIIKFLETWADQGREIEVCPLMEDDDTEYEYLLPQIPVCYNVLCSTLHGLEDDNNATLLGCVIQHSSLGKIVLLARNRRQKFLGWAVYADAHAVPPKPLWPYEARGCLGILDGGKVLRFADIRVAAPE